MRAQGKRERKKKQTTYKHGSVRRHVGEGVVHVVHAAVVHHAGGRAVVDLEVREVDGVGEHDARRAGGFPPSR